MRDYGCFGRRDFMKKTTGMVLGLWLPQFLPLRVGKTAEKVERGAKGTATKRTAKEAGVAKSEPISLSPGPHLFIDSYLIESQDNLKRTVNHPTRLPQPVVTGLEDKCFQPYVTVLRDPVTTRFRIWYNVPESASQSHLAYMESEDGIHWIRPHRVLDDPARIQFGASIIDEGPDYPNPSQRYKYGWWNDGGLQVAASPDGLSWKPIVPGVVLYHNHDINSIAWDPIRRRYMAFVSMYIPGPTWTGSRRIPHMSVSRDLIHWKKPWMIFAPDEKDEGETQFYCMAGVLARGDLLIGMLKVLRDDLKASNAPPGGYGIGYTVIAWSRDGEHWERDREPFMDRNPKPGTWDHAMAWADCQLLVGDEVYIYYGGYARGHKVERFTERQIGLARMPRDRYVSREAGEVRGYLRTPLVVLNVARMTVNAKVEGELRVRILDESGKPLRGFDWTECAPVRGDSILHPVDWKRPIISLRGKPIQLEFALRKAKLYAFQLHE